MRIMTHTPGANGEPVSKKAPAREFIDDFGVKFDPGVHATHKNGMPIKNKDGSYRALPGKADIVAKLKKKAGG